MTAGCVRVVFLVSTLRRAGPTSVLLEILRHLDARRFDPVIVTLSPEPADSMAAAFRETAAPVRSLSMSRLRAQFHRGWRRDLERASGVPLDGRCVVHSHGIRGDVISSTALAGVPRIATAHNYPYEDYVMKYGALQGRWMAWTHVRAFRSLPHVVACSSTLAERLRHHSVAATVIRNGVDTGKFSAPSAEERQRLRSGLGVPAQARIGVCVGALSVRKQPLRVIRAMREIDDPTLIMLIVGGGQLEAECRREAQGDARIRFTGHTSDSARYLRAADFFVSASRSEGLPVAALEAMACGLHVVLSDIDPHRELLEIAPVAGALFASADRHALTAAIAHAALHTPKREGSQQRRIAERVGSLTMTQHYQELYARLAGEAAAA
jgi:glycosyltransferase involved in cell wall biosynthesis